VTPIDHAVIILPDNVADAGLRPLLVRFDAPEMIMA
jgi:hypothetical protein